MSPAEEEKMVKIKQKIDSKDLKEILSIVEKVENSACLFQAYTTLKGSIQLQGYFLTPKETVEFRKWFDSFRRKRLKEVK